ncbi:MAG: YafY family transcriptional regulator [Chloroflexi bacterium]|nr:YafY family transcriptional regulator [Chloroflexota bacterium]
MYNPTLRLLTILELLQSHEQLSAQELAERLEVEERSIRRYIMMLRDIGIPIDSERGRYGGYSIRPGFRMPPLMFNHDEIVAVMVGLMFIRELGALDNLWIDSATSKIERVLPEELKVRSNALRKFLSLDMLPFPIYGVSSQHLLAISLAASEKRCLLVRYMSPQAEVTERIISPYGVLLHGKIWYVPAYCHLRENCRIFRLDRVRDVADSEENYEAADIDPKTYVLESLANMPGIYEFKVILHVPLETVSLIVPPSMAILEEHSGETLMRCYADDAYWLARYLARLELPFTVMETDELRLAIRNIAEQMLASLQKQMGG